MPRRDDTGAERTTELWGKCEMGDAAQYGVQRLMANVVVPVARAVVHDDQFVDVRRVLASAQETTSLRGRTTEEPEQVRTPDWFAVAIEGAVGDTVGEEPTELTPTPIAATVTATTARKEKARRVRRRRSRRRASRKSISTP